MDEKRSKFHRLTETKHRYLRRAVISFANGDNPKRYYYLASRSAAALELLEASEFKRIRLENKPMISQKIANVVIPRENIIKKPLTYRRKRV